jgi:peptidoglycan hydrolase CwlO-like protein
MAEMTKDEARKLRDASCLCNDGLCSACNELHEYIATLAQQLQAQSAEAAELDRRRRLAGEEAARLQERASSLFDKLVAANARAEAAEADARRYKSLRRLNARQFAELFERNLAGENFDAMVDALLDPATVNAEGESNG